MTRKTLLLGAATALALSSQAHAGHYLFGGNGPIPDDVDQRPGAKTVQIMMDNGAIVSLVDADNFQLNGNDLRVRNGGVTIVGGTDAVVQVDAGEGRVARVTGSASLTVGPDGFSGNVISGSTEVMSGPRQARFDRGAAWRAAAGEAARRVFANAAQGVPEAAVTPLRRGGLQAAAQNGIPVVLGNALAALGAEADLVAAARNVDARVDNPSLGTLPSGTVDLLLAYSGRLAAALGGSAPFEAADPQIIDAYLRFLASGGQTGDFRSAYSAIITQYLTLLANGGTPGDFTGLDLASVNAYLGYLSNSGALASLAEQQRALVQAYLDYLAQGGNPAGFVTPATSLNEETLASYIAAIENYVSFLSSGGNPGDFGVSASLIQTYLTQLRAAGLLETLLPAQAAALEAYLDFLADGGSAGDFTGFTPLTPEVLASYGDVVSAYLAFISNGGDPAAYSGASTALIRQYLSALQGSGMLDSLFGAQAELLRTYLAYLGTGGAPGDFTGFADLPIGATLAQQYAAAVNAFLTFIDNGGVPSEYGALNADALRAYLQALKDSGYLEALLAAQADFLETYLAYLSNGGAIDDFPDLPEPISDTQKLAIVDAFLTHVKANGLPSTFTGAGFEALLAYFNDVASLKLQQADRYDDNAFLNTYFSYVQYADQDADAFPGLPANGGSTRTRVYTYSMNRTAYDEAFTDGGFALPIVLDADGVPVYLLSNVLLSGEHESVVDAGTRTISTRVYGGRYTVSGSTEPLTADQGLHFTTAAPATNVPTDATINYVLETATSPTFNDGSSAPGTFDAEIAVKYGGTQIRLAAEGTVSMPGDADYSFTTPGGIAGLDALPVTTYPGASNNIVIQQSAALSGTGKACLSGETGCELYLRASPGGDGARALVVAYNSRHGGDGSVGFGGSAGFVASNGGGNTGGGDIDSDVGVNFDGSSTYSLQASAESDGNDGLATKTLGHIGSLERSSDGGIETLLANGGATVTFGRGTLPLLSLAGNDDVLVARYGAGTYDTGASPGIVPDGQYLGLVSISNPADLLPVSGTATYSLISDLPPSASTGQADGSFDIAMAIAFGALPRVALEGTLTLDTSYEFETNGGLDGLMTGGVSLYTAAINLSAPVVSGMGDFCTSGTGCSVRVTGRFGQGFESFGGFYQTYGGTEQAVGVFAMHSDDIANIAYDGGPGETSGSLTDDFGHADFLPLIVDGGGSNIATSSISNNSVVDGTFDDRGLISLVLDSSTSNQGYVIADRGDALTADLDGDADWQLGRFTGATVGTTIFGKDNGSSYALIPLLSNEPASGTISYTLKSATRPVYSNEATAPGSFDGAMTVTFGSTAKAGIEGTVTMADAVYSFATAGGAAAPSWPLQRITGDHPGLALNSFSTPTSADSDGAACTAAGPCVTRLQGWIGGDGASLASIGYIIYADTTYSRPTLSGTAIFEGGALTGGAEPIVGTTRTDQIIVYSGSVVGIDERDPVSVTYDDTTGGILAYSWPPNETPDRGTTTVKDAGHAGDTIGWSRWAGGTTGGKYFASNGYDMPENGGWHTVAGTPATNLPTSGTLSYSLAGATAATIRDGSLTPGTIAGSAAVAFGATPHVGVELDVTIGGNSYALASPGGVATPSSGMAVDTGNAMRFQDYGIAVSGSGPVCGGSGSCTGVITGFLAGDGASHIGLAFTFGNAGFDKQVDGGVVFAKD